MTDVIHVYDCGWCVKRTRGIRLGLAVLLSLEEFWATGLKEYREWKCREGAAEGIALCMALVLCEGGECRRTTCCWLMIPTLAGIVVARGGSNTGGVG